MTQNISTDILAIRTELKEFAEDKYRQFASKLIPNCDNILGVRIPTIRKLAKQIAKAEPLPYLQSDDEIYFEEVMLKGLVIGNLKVNIISPAPSLQKRGEKHDIENLKDLFNQISHFVPKISNWSLCDSFCSELKIARKHKAEFWQFMQPYFHSDETYDIRFAVVMGLFHFIEPDYLELLFEHFNRISYSDPNRDYYVKMAIAWAISMCYVKYPDETLPFLKNNQLDNETHNKALQKIRESNQVDKATKVVMQSMKRIKSTKRKP